ncbi:MAG: DNA polymerase I [Ferrimicrobium sp.]
MVDALGDDAKIPTLLVIDGYSLAFRAFHAFNAINFEMTNGSGMPTTALHGFVKMIADVFKTFMPSHFVVALDYPAPTFRDRLFAEYKGQRSSTPEALVEQLASLRSVLEAIDVEAIDVEGFEADDVIATLVSEARLAGVRSRVITGDRDALQLVHDPECVVMLTRQGVSKLEEMDTDTVIERYGVRPDQYVDFAALRGDASDNLKGVPGIGPKTAAQLIATYGSVAGIRANIDSLPVRHARAIRDNQENLDLALSLTTLRHDVPIGRTVSELAVRPWDSAAAAAVLVGTFDLRKGFESLQAAFKGRNDRSATAFTHDDHPPAALTWLSSKEVLNRASSKGQVYVGFASAGERGRSSVSAFGVAVEGVGTVVVGDEANALLASPEVGGFEWHGLHLKELVRARAMLEGVDAPESQLVDLGVLTYLVDPTERRNDLSELVLRILGREVDGEVPVGLFDDIDGVATLRHELAWLPLLEEGLRKRIALDRLERLAFEVEIPLVRVLARMEIYGVAVDEVRLQEIGVDLLSETEGLLERLQELTGATFNPNSPKQLAEVLFERLGLPPGKRTKTGYSTDASVLEQLREAHPAVAVLLRYRELEKLRATFYEGLVAETGSDGRIHATYNQTVARTGRISSEHPNLQNIPIRSTEGRKFREVFVAPPGRLLVAADYSQIELRVLAHLARDPALIQALSADEDVHRMVASFVFGVAPERVTDSQRSVAKMVSYGLSYGMEAYGLSQRLAVSTAEADSILQRFFAAFPTLYEYRDQVVAEARDRGFTRTLLGRRRYLPDLNSTSRTVRLGAERQAMNAATQGLAADIFKIALVRLDARLVESTSRLVLQVHDEVVVEADESEVDWVRSVVTETLSGALELVVPLVVNVGAGRTWADAKEKT